MQCAYCKETIDEDSYFCDQCGEETKVCPGCQKTGKGKACTSCGTTLVLAKDMPSISASSGSSSAGKASMSPNQPSAISPPIDPPAGGTVRHDDGHAASSSAPPELRLMNKNLNIDLAIQSNSVLGRTTGSYVSVFGSYDQVSGKHCSFSFESGKGWRVADLGSTNGTKLNNIPLVPNNPQSLNDKMFLKIANIEFYVQIK